MRSMNSLGRLIAVCAVALAAPHVISACSSDDSGDQPEPDEDAGGGGPGGSGGTAGGSGGTPPGGSGGAPPGGSGGTPPGGSGGTGGTSPEAAPPACDLSGTGLTRMDMPATGDRTLTSGTVWTLRDQVYVADGETLTIEPCTRIEGTTSPMGVLVIQRGGQIMAEGTANEPILFTSQLPPGQRAAGNWGGVILLGRAPNFNGPSVAIEGLQPGPENEYGGTVMDDNSGTMRFVRIEFGGFELSPGNEINGLTMGSVGSGTVIENIMVNTTLDDCFEWFGGTVNASNLICNNGGDDMFDADQGYRGTIDTIFGRQVNSSSQDPNGLEMDSNTDTTVMPVTQVTLNNATLCGVIGGTSASNGMVLRELLTGAFDNVVTTFFDSGVDIRNPFGTPAAPNVTIANSVFFGNTNNIGEPDATDDDDGFDENAWFTMVTTNNADDPGYTAADCQAATGPAATVTGSGVGAFADSATWMEGQWVSWEIQ